MMNFIKKTTLVAVASFSLVSCRDDDDTIITSTDDVVQSSVIQNITNNVIIATYKDLNLKAQALRTAINAMTVGDEAALSAAKTAWIVAREPWEKSEGFLYGPVDIDGLDPAMDTWPVDVSGMNNIINSSAAITASVISANDETRGFHLIEFLLWGENGDKTAAQMTQRELEYLRAAADDLVNNTNALHTGWIPTGGNFAQYFLNPNPNSPSYKSRKSVLEEIVNGIFTICDEVANAKIEDAFNGANQAPAPEKEESRFSNNSKKDFADNIRSVQNIYLGYNATGGGISEIVRLKNPNLDNKIKSEIAGAIVAIEAIPGTFSSAIFNNRPAVAHAQSEVSKLMRTVETELKPFISNL